MHVCIVSPHYITKGVSVMTKVMKADFDKMKKLIEDKDKISEEEYNQRFWDAWYETDKETEE